jgi:hypothetical protein
VALFPNAGCHGAIANEKATFEATLQANVFQHIDNCQINKIEPTINFTYGFFVKFT